MLKNKQIKSIAVFENEPVRRVWNAEKEKWYFNVVDVIRILTESVDPGAYWRKLKERLRAEGSESVTKCHGLKMLAKDGYERLSEGNKTKSPAFAELFTGLNIVQDPGLSSIKSIPNLNILSIASGG